MDLELDNARRLWQAVLLENFITACAKRRKETLDSAQARAWIEASVGTSAAQGFEQVCAYVGVDPSYVRRLLKENSNKLSAQELRKIYRKNFQSGD